MIQAKSKEEAIAWVKGGRARTGTSSSRSGSCSSPRMSPSWGKRLSTATERPCTPHDRKTARRSRSTDREPARRSSSWTARSATARPGPAGRWPRCWPIASPSSRTIAGAGATAATRSRMRVDREIDDLDALIRRSRGIGVRLRHLVRRRPRPRSGQPRAADQEAGALRIALHRRRHARAAAGGFPHAAERRPLRRTAAATRSRCSSGSSTCRPSRC